jgi:hypothetical protein
MELEEGELPPPPLDPAGGRHRPRLRSPPPRPLGHRFLLLLLPTAFGPVVPGPVCAGPGLVVRPGLGLPGTTTGCASVPGASIVRGGVAPAVAVARTGCFWKAPGGKRGRNLR